VERITASDQIFSTLRTEIMALRFPPGVELNLQVLSTQLGVSKSPVRDALLKLKEDNLVEIFPQRGTRVSLIDLKQVSVERFLRQSLEIPSAKLFCMQRTSADLYLMEKAIEEQKIALNEGDMETFLAKDDAFHQTIFNAVGYMRLWNIVQSQSGNYHRIRLLSFFEPDVRNDIIAKHQMMLSAFQDQDEEQVQRLETDHMGKLEKETEMMLSHHPDYFKKPTQIGLNPV